MVYALPAEKISPEERQFVRNFLARIAETYKGGWDRLISDAGIPGSTAQGWRYGPAPGLPNASNLLKVLRQANVLHEDAMALIDAAARDAADAVARAERLAKRSRRSQERSA